MTNCNLRTELKTYKAFLKGSKMKINNKKHKE